MEVIKKSLAGFAVFDFPKLSFDFLQQGRIYLFVCNWERSGAWEVPHLTPNVRQRTVVWMVLEYHMTDANGLDFANLAILLPDQGKLIMLYTIAGILILIWGLSLISSFTAGGFIHALLVIAIIMVVYQLITGRRVV